MIICVPRPSKRVGHQIRRMVCRPTVPVVHVPAHFERCVGDLVAVPDMAVVFCNFAKQCCSCRGQHGHSVHYELPQVRQQLQS